MQVVARSYRGGLWGASGAMRLRDGTQGSTELEDVDIQSPRAKLMEEG